VAAFSGEIALGDAAVSWISGESYTYPHRAIARKYRARGRRVKKHLIIAIGLFLAITALLAAQTATGVIRGTVQDVTGAVLIDVQVRLVDGARNQSWEQTTNEEGFLSSGRCRSASTGSRLNILALRKR
jgi:hypothetical protein